MTENDWPDDFQLDLMTEEGREECIGDLVVIDPSDEGRWCKAIVMQQGDNLIVRALYPDGGDEILDAKINRVMTVTGLGIVGLA